MAVWTQSPEARPSGSWKPGLDQGLTRVATRWKTFESERLKIGSYLGGRTRSVRSDRAYVGQGAAGPGPWPN